MRFGVNLPSFGPTAMGYDLGELASRAEIAGFESVWVSDHVVMPSSIASRYPFSPDGEFPWPVDEPWFDPLVALSFAAARTKRVELGVGVLIAPLRNPVALAKQVASIDSYSGGRFVLGVGAGWMREEFDHLDVPWERRGERLEDTVAVMRSCWHGRTQRYEGSVASVDEGVWCVPTPAREVPVLFGASTTAGTRRAGRFGNGFVGFALAERLDAERIAETIALVRSSAREHRREEAVTRFVYRVSGRAADVAAAIPALERAGVTEIVVSVGWSDPGSAARAVDRLRSGA